MITGKPQRCINATGSEMEQHGGINFNTAVRRGDDVIAMLGFPVLDRSAQPVEDRCPRAPDVPISIDSTYGVSASFHAIGMSHSGRVVSCKLRVES